MPVTTPWPAISRKGASRSCKTAPRPQVDQQSAVAAERRTHPRFPYTERLQIETQSGREPALGFARDLSKGGIAFITTAPLPLEVRVLGLPRSGGEPLRVRVLILRCTRIMEGFYDIGARFLALEASSYATLVQNSDASGDA
jgi:hypothetical protein